MSSPAVHQDAIVVGGRIAGALTAAHLASRGMRVLVLESRGRLAATVSTHFFRGDGLVRAFDELGLLDKVLATGAPRLTCEYRYFGGGEVPKALPPQEPGRAGFCLSVRRETLDPLLADHVRQMQDVTYLSGTRVVDVIREDEAVAGVRLESGASFRAPVVIGADGRRSSFAQLVGAGFQQRHAGRRAMYYQYVTGWSGPEGGPADGPEFSLLGDELAYVFPSDDGMACVALSIGLEQYGASRADPGAFFAARLKAHRGLWPRLRGSAARGPQFLGIPHDSVVRQAAGPGWALVGDSGTYQDPWTGFGMDTAARQAQALGATILPSPDGWQRAYSDERDKVTLERFGATVIAAPDLALLLAK